MSQALLLVRARLLNKLPCRSVSLLHRGELRRLTLIDGRGGYLLSSATTSNTFNALLACHSPHNLGLVLSRIIDLICSTLGSIETVLILLLYSCRCLDLIAATASILAKAGTISSLLNVREASSLLLLLLKCGRSGLMLAGHGLTDSVGPAWRARSHVDLRG